MIQGWFNKNMDNENAEYPPQKENFPRMDLQFILGSHGDIKDITERTRKAFEEADIIALEGVGLPEHIDNLNRISRGGKKAEQDLENEEQRWSQGINNDIYMSADRKKYIIERGNYSFGI